MILYRENSGIQYLLDFRKNLKMLQKINKALVMPIFLQPPAWIFVLSESRVFSASTRIEMRIIGKLKIPRDALNNIAYNPITRYILRHTKEKIQKSDDWFFPATPQRKKATIGLLGILFSALRNFGDNRIIGNSHQTVAEIYGKSNRSGFSATVWWKRCQTRLFEFLRKALRGMNSNPVPLVFKQTPTGENEKSESYEIYSTRCRKTEEILKPRFFRKKRVNSCLEFDLWGFLFRPLQEKTGNPIVVLFLQRLAEIYRLSDKCGFSARHCGKMEGIRLLAIPYNPPNKKWNNHIFEISHRPLVGFLLLLDYRNFSSMPYRNIREIAKLSFLCGALQKFTYHSIIHIFPQPLLAFWVLSDFQYFNLVTRINKGESPVSGFSHRWLAGN